MAFLGVVKKFGIIIEKTIFYSGFAIKFKQIEIRLNFSYF